MTLGARVRTLLPSVAPALLVAALLLVRIAADPPPGLTASRSPYTDEGWQALNARNLVVLGTWAIDDWALHAVNLPFSVLAATSFAVLGPGLVPLRLVSVLATVLTVALLGGWTAARWGPLAGTVAALGYGCSTLVLGHGGTGLLEPLVTLLLVAGFAVLLPAEGDGPRRSDARALAAGCLLAAALATKPSALLGAAGMLAGLVAWGIADRRALRSAVLASLAIAAAGLGGGIGLLLAEPGALDAARRIWVPVSWPTGVADAWEALRTWPSEGDAALALAAPLFAAGAIGLVLVPLERRLDRRRALVAAVAWLLVSLLVLVLASYRPNRYLLPLLPALAILAAAGTAGIAGRLRPMPARVAIVAAMLAVVTLPGLVAWSGWVARDTRQIAGAQAAIAATVPAGAAIEGELAPTLGMSSAARLITSRPQDGINAGDLYRTEGVRWFLGADDERPSWAELHPEAWRAREPRHCLTVAGEEVCLLELP